MREHLGISPSVEGIFKDQTTLRTFNNLEICDENIATLPTGRHKPTYLPNDILAALHHLLHLVVGVS